MGRESQFGLCNGVIIAVPNATFIALWIEAYRAFDPDSWAHSSVYLPDTLWNQHKSLIHVEHDTLHRPNWKKEEMPFIYDANTTYNWRNNYAMHLWYKHYDKEHDPQQIRSMTSTLGYMFRYIYYGNPDVQY